jgi:hypothetical protein
LAAEMTHVWLREFALSDKSLCLCADGSLFLSMPRGLAFFLIRSLSLAVVASTQRVFSALKHFASDGVIALDRARRTSSVHFIDYPHLKYANLCIINHQNRAV